VASDGERVLPAAARVVPELASAAGGSGLRVEPLSGGVGRRTYHVWFDGDRASFEGNSWAVRVADGRVEGSLDLASECEVGRAAAEAGLAPRVVGFDAAAGVLVTEYLGDARALSSAHTRDAETIDRLATLLRSLHALAPRPRAFEPERFAASYLDALGGAGRLAAGDRAHAAELVRLARDYSARHSDEVLCHNDLVASNILDDRGRLQLIDFEYAVSAAPILDLAGLAALNGYSADERERLVEAYYAGAVPPFGPDDLDRVVRLVRLIGYFWALAAACSAPDAERFREFAEQARGALGH
jgi:thiamine kinase-like enzyme